MKYDFETVFDRRGKDAISVDLACVPGKNTSYSFNGVDIRDDFEFIPMWVADMNFRNYPGIDSAMINRINEPALGYFMPRDEYYDAIIRWQERKNNVEDLKKEAITYENGVLGGVSTALRVLAGTSGKVLVHSPTYVGFTHVLQNNGYEVFHSPLVRNDSGKWMMDYEDMEKQIRENNIHAVIFCTPHNPTGRVWERKELETAMDIFKRHDVYVISDEIWSDMILPGHKHIPTQSVSEDARQRTIAFYAPSKTFNLAGLVGSYGIIYNKYLRDRFLKESSLSHYNSMNVLSMYALIGAYTDGGYDWCCQLCDVIAENVDYAYNFITSRFKGVKLSKPEGSYLLYLDCTEWLEDHSSTLKDLLEKGWEYGVGWQNGEDFLMPRTIRMNLALPKKKVIEAFDRLERYVF